ncbi:oxidoreductase-like domain-containing protein [Solimonas soli]|uniref:oxidoreductase-like domain-containing protein n=1 Tax=Solimonas soli TaxID=413479 RepID=UPI0004BC3220|nr:oxidoreductase-like domain-containing protein [Solimonas soli]
MIAPDEAAPDGDEDLPPPPDMPDCCFSGCAQCVLDTHAEEMREWRARVAAIRAGRKAPEADRGP